MVGLEVYFVFDDLWGNESFGLQSQATAPGREEVCRRSGPVMDSTRSLVICLAGGVTGRSDQAGFWAGFPAASFAPALGFPAAASKPCFTVLRSVILN